MIKRTIEAAVQRTMSQYPASVIFGPRQCGKTTLAKAMYPDFSYANLDDSNTRELAEEDPYEFFHVYPEPVIIDEIQQVPDLTAQIMVRIDEHQGKGRYVLTGSSQLPLKKAAAESLAGRCGVIRMSALSLEEIASAGFDIDRDETILTGCLPRMYNEKTEIQPYADEYLSTFMLKDVLKDEPEDAGDFIKLLKLLSARIGSLVNISSLSGELSVSSLKVRKWLTILEECGVIYLLRPWMPSASSRVVKSPKIYFFDTLLPAYLLGLKTPSQVASSPHLGPLFENLVVMEAVKTGRNSWSEERLYYFRNQSGLEVDLLYEKDINTLVLSEIKSGKGLKGEFTRPMSFFCSKYGNFSKNVIYSGDDIDAFSGARFWNYKGVSKLFKPDEPYIFDPAQRRK